ncbi:hypothetical protein FGO68_gene3222 [Halteria grandinella]|uniref:Uncharacterized protein n=1 Tax=Halteria grandinella TaxID=5974 RepID=A0A8J8P014_HALGN|nr:hypothetical protein FGO68_gene3222 [Halteria grandinella]
MHKSTVITLNSTEIIYEGPSQGALVTWLPQASLTPTLLLVKALQLLFPSQFPQNTLNLSLRSSSHLDTSSHSPRGSTLSEGINRIIIEYCRNLAIFDIDLPGTPLKSDFNSSHVRRHIKAVYNNKLRKEVVVVYYEKEERIKEDDDSDLEDEESPVSSLMMLVYRSLSVEGKLKMFHYLYRPSGGRLVLQRFKALSERELCPTTC